MNKSNITGIIIAITALIDTNFNLLLDIGLSESAVGWIRLSGLFIALMLPKLSFGKKEEAKKTPLAKAASKNAIGGGNTGTIKK